MNTALVFNSSQIKSYWLILRLYALFILSILFFNTYPLNAQLDYLKFDNIRVEQGLSNNMVHCSFQDSKGWMWFGTTEGVNRFDGYKFIKYVPVANDSTSIRGTLVRNIVEDSLGFLWMGTDNGGLNKFDRKKNIFKRYLKGEAIKFLKLQNGGILWIATQNGLFKLNIRNDNIIKYSHNPLDNNSLRNNYIRSLEVDKTGNLWVGTNTGLDYLKKGTEKFQHIKYTVQQLEDEIHCIFSDPDGSIWLGTFNYGFYIYHPESNYSEHFIPDKNYERSFSIRKIVRDNNGFYWLATRGGLYVFNRKNKSFSFHSYSDRDPNSLCNNSILDILEDRYGDIWIGTRGGISYLTRGKQVFKHFKSFVDDSRYLNNPEIYAFWLEKNGNLWIGTESGGINILNPNTGKYSYITRSTDKLQSNTIKAFADDGKGNLWVASFRGGLHVIDIRTKRVTKYFLHNPDDPGSIADNRVWSVLFDFYGNLWVGTDKGLDRYDFYTKKFIHYAHITNGTEVSLISEDTEHELWVSTSKKIYVYNSKKATTRVFDIPGRALFIDSKGRFWLTSFYKGLYLIDKQKGVLKNYLKKDGLVDNRTHCIFEDQLGFLWISTANGLSKFDPGKAKFINYDMYDGLQHNQFNYGAGLKLPSGELVLGGVNGFNLFNPDMVKPQQKAMPLVFTDFRLFYKPVPIGDQKNAILKEDISEATSITLPYDQNVFTIEFSALSFAQIHKNNYAYKLEGFDKNWNEIGEKHTAIYTNLNPGNYVFHVKSWNSDDLFKIQEISLKVKVKPPFWSTLWFKTIMVLALLFVIYLLVNFILYRNRLKQELVVERIKAKQIHELDMLKMKFFTNISHEIRTPLTLIIGPVEKMMHNPLSEKEQKSLLDIVYRNAQQMLRLVNQLLDFRKIETGNLKLELKKGDIVEFINAVVGSFEQMAKDKGIQLKVSAVQKEIFSFFDPDKVEKICNNLLSNALKFTNRDGSVSVSLSLIMDNSADNPDESINRFIEIVVKDTGIGITESNLEKIFHRFFQSQDSLNNSGTGIGLALTRELVKLHNGKITVESRPGKGTRFTVLLPFITVIDEIHPHPVEDASLQTVEEIPAEAQENEDVASDKILLVVEDNIDVRFFIRSNFTPEYKVLEASDGKEGINLAFKHIPDVIISDIMMPGTDGIELCKKLKKDERTSHIPIIILTALTSKENLHNGLAAGADDYITKPFDVSILQAKVDNLFMLRKSLQMKYSGEMMLQPKNVTLTSPDEKFLKKAIETVEKHIDDTELDSDSFANHLGVSRMQLYRKLGALTDMTVKDFIRDIRLKRATQLLVQNKLNVSEVAYAVGFKDLSHFRKCFRQEFGMTASEYVKKFGE